MKRRQGSERRHGGAPRRWPAATTGRAASPRRLASLLVSIYGQSPTRVSHHYERYYVHAFIEVPTFFFLPFLLHVDVVYCHKDYSPIARAHSSSPTSNFHDHPSLSLSLCRNPPSLCDEPNLVLSSTSFSYAERRRMLWGQKGTYSHPEVTQFLETHNL